MKITGAGNVRLATASDVMHIVDLVEDLREAVNGLMPVNRPWTAQFVAGLIDSPQGVVFVSGDGFIAGMLQPTVINPAHIALENGWFARDGSGRALRLAFEDWGRKQGAEMVKLSTGAIGPDLSKDGYVLTEKTWVKRL